MNERNQPSDKSRQPGIEQRLSKLKPRQPFIDIEEIARIAESRDIAESKNGVERTVSAAAPQSKNWSSPSVLAGTVAASWLCGVAVGASAIFLTWSKDQPSEVNLRVAGSGTIEQPQESIALTPTTPSTVESNIADASLSAPSDLLRWDLGMGTEPLQAGMSLRSRNRLVRTDALASGNAMARNSPRGSSDLQNAIGPILDASSPLPTAPITQAELLKSLLQDTNEDIH